MPTPLKEKYFSRNMSFFMVYHDFSETLQIFLLILVKIWPEVTKMSFS